MLGLKWICVLISDRTDCIPGPVEVGAYVLMQVAYAEEMKLDDELAQMRVYAAETGAVGLLGDPRPLADDMFMTKG
jgi:hypothetical protein